MKTAIEERLRAWQARMRRRAISPRLAMRTEEKGKVEGVEAIVGEQDGGGLEGVGPIAD